MGFSRQEYWSGLPFPSPGDLPDPGIKPRSPAFQADALPSEPSEKHRMFEYSLFFFFISATVFVCLLWTVICLAASSLRVACGIFRCGIGPLVVARGLWSTWAQWQWGVSLVVLQHMGSSFPDQGLILCPLHWRHWVLTTGPPGKFQLYFWFFYLFQDLAGLFLLLVIWW